jgi:cell wall assembly regulator SMI1
VKLPADFRAFYQWKNGQPLDSSESLSGHRVFMPLDEIAEVKRGLDAKIGFDFVDPKLWRRCWVPFQSYSERGDYLCLDLTTYDGGEFGQLVAYYHNKPDRPVEFDAFRELLDDYVEALEE